MEDRASPDQRALVALNRRLLARQHLSIMASGPGAVVRAAEGCCGINSQDLQESFSSFWARVRGFRDSDLAAELRPKGRLVRTWTVRNTMHIVSTDDYWAHVLGGAGRRFRPLYDRLARERGIPDLSARTRLLYEPFLDHIRGRAASTGEAKEFMAEALTRKGYRGRMRLQRGWSSEPTYGTSWSGMSEMSSLGLLVNAGRRGSESLWMGTADWLGSGRRVPDQEECVVALVRRYVECYGPVSRADIAYWTYLRTSDVDAALKSLKGETSVRRLGPNVEAYSLDAGSRAAKVPPRAVVLPEFDSLMMGYKDKSRFLPADRVKSVFSRLGGVRRTILMDGFVAATWGRRREKGGVTASVTPFKSLSESDRSSIEARFQDYADYLGTAVAVEFGG